MSRTTIGKGAPGRVAAAALLVVMGAMWGLQFAMLKIAAESGRSELGVLMQALALLSIAFGALLVLRRQVFRLNREILVFLVITSLLGYVFPLTAAVHAAAHIPAGMMTLLASSAPVATVLAALMLRLERISARRLTAVLFGLLAVLVALWPELEAPGLGAASWMAVALVVPVCYGVESLYIAAYWPKGMTALQAVTGETWVALVMVAPIWLIYGAPAAALPEWSEADLAIAAFVLAGVVESLLYFFLIQHTGGVFVAFGTFISLFAGIFWGMALFGERHGPLVWAAAAAMVLALALACLDRPRSGEEAKN